jgi:hypothetical protein
MPRCCASLLTAVGFTRGRWAADQHHDSGTSGSLSASIAAIAR